MRYAICFSGSVIVEAASEEEAFTKFEAMPDSAIAENIEESRYVELLDSDRQD